MASTLWTPLFSFMVFVCIFAVGDWISNITKSRISGMLVAMLIYLAGFQLGIIPASSLADTGIPAVASNFAIMLILVGMGTMLDLKSLLAQWKTVIIALVALVGLALVSFTVSSWLVGREYALCAASPISGGVIAGLMTSEAANLANRPDLAAFAILIIGCQGFIGIPICSTFTRKYANGLLDGSIVEKGASREVSDEEAAKLRIIKKMPRWMAGNNTVIAKMAMVGVLSYYLSALTGGAVNVNIMYLIMGILFCELGFLDKNATAKAHIDGFVMLAVLSVLPGNLATIDMATLLQMLVPLLVTLVLGAIGIALFGVAAGKVLGIHWSASIAIAICCTIGYPGTQIIVDEVTRGLDCTEEERARVYDVVLPKIVVSGFASVTVASVIFAGIICPMIF